MIYLDNSATSRFKPQAVLDAVLQELKFSSNPGRSGHTEAIDAAIRLYEARKCIKEFVGADDSYEVVFTSGCTESLNLAVLGYLTRFDERVDVVTTLNEHNAVLRPLYRLHAHSKVNVILVEPAKDGSVSPADIKNALTHKTKLVAVNHISNVTGAQSDIAEISKITSAAGIPILVDGAQSLGHTPVNMLDQKIDMLAGAGHKGLHGPQGVGFLVFRSDLRMNPIKFGGTGTASESVTQPDLPPEAYESGTLNMPAIMGLYEGIQWTSKHFLDLHHHNHYLSGEMLYGLKQIPKLTLYSEYPSSVISFNIHDFSSSEVANKLDEQNIAVRSGLHCAPLIHKHLGTLHTGAVRASIGYCNNISDIKATLSGIEQIVRQI